VGAGVLKNKKGKNIAKKRQRKSTAKLSRIERREH